MKRKIYLTPTSQRVLIALEGGICVSSNEDAGGGDTEDGGTTVDPWEPGGGGDVEFD